jgi:hypothetical protein
LSKWLAALRTAVAKALLALGTYFARSMLTTTLRVGVLLTTPKL